MLKNGSLSIIIGDGVIRLIVWEGWGMIVDREDMKGLNILGVDNNKDE